MNASFEQDLLADAPNITFLGTTQMGRYATKVRVINGGAYHGADGVVVRTIHPEYISVRLTSGRHAGVETGFGPSELEVV